MLDYTSRNYSVKVAGSQIHLLCVEDEALFCTDEMNAERIFVNCEPEESEEDESSENGKKPDFLDVDKDGDKDESFSKAVKDKEDESK